MLGRDQRVFCLRGQNDNSHHRTNERSQKSKQIQITDVIRIDFMTGLFFHRISLNSRQSKLKKFSELENQDFSSKLKGIPISPHQNERIFC